MRERHVSHAHLIEKTQNGERTLDGLSAFDAEHAGDAFRREGSSDVIGGSGHFEHVGIASDHSVHQIDLFHECDRGVLSLMFTTDVDGPELRRISVFDDDENDECAWADLPVRQLGRRADV